VAGKCSSCCLLQLDNQHTCTHVVTRRSPVVFAEPLNSSTLALTWFPTCSAHTLSTRLALFLLQELLSGSSDASSSLMRQIQALAQQASAAQASATEQEQQLLSRLRAAEQTAADATASERDAASRAASAEAALQAAREAATAAVQVGAVQHICLKACPFVPISSIPAWSSVYCRFAYLQHNVGTIGPQYA